MEQINENPVNVCLKQGKRLKVISRLKKDALAGGTVEFEHEYSCVDGEQQQQ
jgi:hypothetical protein